MIFLAVPCLLFSYLYSSDNAGDKQILSFSYKIVASLCFLLLAYFCKVPFLMGIGLISDALGDLFLGLRKVLKNGKVYFFIGSVFFLTGHLCYDLYLMPLAGLEIWQIIVSAVVALVIYYLLIFYTKPKLLYKIFGIFYIVSVFFVFSSSLFIYLKTGEMLLMTAGSLLFFLSDCLLVIYNFGKKKRRIVHIVYSLSYYLGQCLIVLAFL